jgi:hypothetical protein
MNMYARNSEGWVWDTDKLLVQAMVGELRRLISDRVVHNPWFVIRQRKEGKRRRQSKDNVS